MPKPNTAYQVIENKPDHQPLVSQLNTILNQVADRLDKLEGYRETLETNKATFNGDVTVNADLSVNDDSGKKIHSME